MAALVAGLLGPAACIAADAAGPTLRFRQGDGLNESSAFEVVGLPDATLAHLRTTKLERAEWAALFAVYTGDADSVEAGGLPAMLGSWRVETDRLSFVPLWTTLTMRMLLVVEGLNGSTQPLLIW